MNNFTNLDTISIEAIELLKTKIPEDLSKVTVLCNDSNETTNLKSELKKLIQKVQFFLVVKIRKRK